MLGGASGAEAALQGFEGALRAAAAGERAEGQAPDPVAERRPGLVAVPAVGCLGAGRAQVGLVDGSRFIGETRDLTLKFPGFTSAG